MHAKDYLFEALDVYDDRSFRRAALNMAIDEALLVQSNRPSLRIYRWDYPALSFGYFGKYQEAKNVAANRDMVRRWTGGGIVLHGDDVTYSLMIPAGHAAFNSRPMSIYEAVHRAIRNTLAATGHDAVLAPVHTDPKRQESPDRGGRYGDGSCFANPVPADVILQGRKVAGSAQRRTRLGLLQQGSVQQVELAPDFGEQFAAALCLSWKPVSLGYKILQSAVRVAEQRYASDVWLRRR